MLPQLLHNQPGSGRPNYPQMGASLIRGKWAILVSALNGACMSQPTFTTSLTIGELEATYPVYCKAMRILIREGKSLEQIQRSVCWRRLTSLHHCLPKQYKNPSHLYIRLKQDLCA